MSGRNRREFLSDVGGGMLVAGLGSSLAFDLGVSTALAEPGKDRLDFGAREALVSLMQDTPPDKLLPILVEKIKGGADLKELVAAAALANVRTLGGEHYVGFHTMMALMPAVAMSGELPSDRRALPILKVLYRNSTALQSVGGSANEVLHPVAPAEVPAKAEGLVRDAVRKLDMERAEAMVAGLAAQSPEAAFNEVLAMVEDGHEVHRVVMPYRAYDLLNIVGKEHAATMLRQSVHYCVRSEKNAGQVAVFSPARALVPKLLDQYKLLGRPAGTREADDAWVEHLSRTIFEGSKEGAAEAVAAALAEGFSADAIGEALSLAANQLVLRDEGRPKSWAQPNKPEGSIHGDSVGVHASDTANAWRNMAKLSNDRNRVVCLILGGLNLAQDRGMRDKEFRTWTPWPSAEDLAAVKATDPKTLLAEAEEAIHAKDQRRACAAIQKYGDLGHAARDAFDLMLKYSTSEDGALHAEKYYRTTCDEFTHTRPAFRWRQVTALARVVASAYGQPAPGYAEACGLLGIS